jgi:putative transposase
MTEASRRVYPSFPGSAWERTAREAPPRTRVPAMTRSRYRIYGEHYPYFMTATIVAWLLIFAYPQLVDIVLDSWRFLQRERGVEIFGYVILENHLHWIARAEELSEKVGQFKSFTARRIVDTLESRGFQTMLDELGFFKLRHKTGQTHQLWQEGNHPQQIQGDEVMLQKLEYMHNNPVRRGYVDDPVYWRYSSARDYAGSKGLIDVVTDWR